MFEVGLFYVISALLYIQFCKTKKRKLIIRVILFGAFFLSFAHQPLISDDLTREYEALSGIRNSGWAYFKTGTSNYYSGILGVVSSTKFEGIFVSQLIYYIFAHFPVFNFLPAFVVSFQFLLEFSLLEKINRRYNFSQKEMIFLFLLFFLTREIRWMMSGIRNQLAFTIGFYIIYEDLVEKKSKIWSFIGLILCGMIHQSAYILVVYRVILFVKSNKIRMIIAAFMLTWSNMLNLIFKIIQHFSDFSIINSLLWKLTIYTQNDSGTNANVIIRPFYQKIMVSNIGIIVFAFITCWLLFKLLKDERYVMNLGDSIISSKESIADVKTLGMFFVLATCMTVGSNKYYWLYLRFASVLHVGVFVIAGIVIYLLRENGQIHKKNQYMFLGIIAIFIKALIMQFVANSSFYFNLFGLYPR